MESIGSLESHISARVLANSIAVQMTLRAAIELNVFNIIAKSGRGAHLTSKEIVSQISTTNPNLAVKNLERILRLLSVHSLLTTSQKSDPNDQTTRETSYGLTKETLCFVPNEDGVSCVPLVLWGSEMHCIKSLYLLKFTVLEPESSPFYKAHGEAFYEYMSKKPDVSRLFDKVLEFTSYLHFDQKVLEVYRGFEEVKELMDVGGGDGAVIAKIVSMYPHIHGVNFNLPSVIAKAPTYQGVKHVGGDMFESMPSTQSIMLKSVLCDWDDEHCKKILKNCWEALPENGKVIVVEHNVLPEVVENTPEMMPILYCDIYMMALCPGGQERTTAELDNLAKSVGFVETIFFPISHGNYVIEFLKGNVN